MRYEAAWELFAQRAELPVAEPILRDLLVDTRLPADLRKQVRNALTLALIGQRKFTAALETIGNIDEQDEQSQIDSAEAFNYAMAKWGDIGVLDQQLMRRLITSAREGQLPNAANIHQCLAIAYWAIGDREGATHELAKARQLIMDNPRPEFSAWYYLRRQPSAFVKDLDELEHMIHGEDVKPAVLGQEVTESTR
jgi:tetratricopeptide (TPR) repeat protein